MPRPQARTAGLLAGAALLFLIGTNVQAGWLYVIASFLVGAAIAGAWLPRRMLSGIQIERLSPPRVHQGDEAPVDLILINPTSRGRIGLLIEDPFLAPVRMFLQHLPSGARIEMTTDRIATRRGPQGKTGVKLTTSSPFGVVRRNRAIEVEGSTLVLPKVQPLGEVAFLAQTRTSERAIHSFPRHGPGPDFLGVREYKPGDDIRHVHWPSTARHNQVIVREMEEETTRRVGVVLDASRDEGNAWTPLDACCSAAASLSLAAESHGFGARIVWGEAGEVRVHGRTRDEAELLDSLALIRADAGLHLPELIEASSGELRGVQTAVLVFPPWGSNAPDRLAPAIARLSQRVPQVVALIVEPGSDQAFPGCLGEGTIRELTTWLAAAGAEVIRWRIDRPLAEVLGS
jgi:uncharacterized protein (DUF58 family)